MFTVVALLLLNAIPSAAGNDAQLLAQIRDLYTQTREQIHSFTGEVRIESQIEFDLNRLPRDVVDKARQSTIWGAQPQLDQDLIHKERFAFSGEKLFFYEHSGPSETELYRDDRTAWNGEFFTYYSPILRNAIIDDVKDKKGLAYNHPGSFHFAAQLTSLDASMLYKRIVSSHMGYQDIPFLLSMPQVAVDEEDVVVNGSPCVVVRIPAARIVLYFDRQLNFAVRKVEEMDPEGVVWHSFENLEFTEQPSAIGMHLPLHSRQTLYVVSPAPREFWGAPSWSKDYYFTDPQINVDLPDDLFFIRDYPPTTLVRDKISGSFYIAGDPGRAASFDSESYAAFEGSVAESPSSTASAAAGPAQPSNGRPETSSQFSVVLCLTALVAIAAGAVAFIIRRKARP